ncbi:hypothetical protein FS837_007605, partial [Tulasnella sp. UAMH 9824]
MSTTNNLPPTLPLGTPSTEWAKDTQHLLEGKRNDFATPEQETPTTEVKQPPLSRGESKASTVLDIPGGWGKENPDFPTTGGDLNIDTEKAYATVTNAFNSAAQAVQAGLAHLSSPADTSTNRPELKASGPVGAPAHPSSATAGVGETIQGGLNSLAAKARNAVSSLAPAEKPAGPEDPAH